jgi:uncharacterized membrane protein HdeD (DUF308 family)
MKDLLLVFFCIGAGFTLSGIVHTIWRIAKVDEESKRGKIARGVVMVVAGPVMLIESAAKGFLAKTWPAVFFWLATAGAAYWSLALGLFVIDVAIHI